MKKREKGFLEKVGEATVSGLKATGKVVGAAAVVVAEAYEAAEESRRDDSERNIRYIKNESTAKAYRRFLDELNKTYTSEYDKKEIVKELERYLKIDR